MAAVRRRVAATLVATAMAAGFAVLGPAGRSSAANTTVDLGVGRVAEVVTDDAHGHLLISMPDANAVRVFDFDGNSLATISNLPGASGMVIRGSMLYVAETSASSIAAIDLDTLTDQGLVATGIDHPLRLAFAGARLWVGSAGAGFLPLVSAALDGTVTVYPALQYYQPDFGTSPGTPDVLIVGEDGLSPGELTRLDVSGATPLVTARTPTDWPPSGGGNIQQLAVSPDGTRLIPAVGAPYVFQELSPTTLAPDGISYPGNAYPVAVTTSPAGGGLLATALTGYNPTDLSVFQLGNTQPIFTASTTTFNNYKNNIPHGLALSADGTRLFTVTIDGVSGAAALWIFDVPAPATAPSTTTLSSAPNPSETGQSVTLTATVQPADATGSVFFYDGGGLIAGCGGQPLVPTDDGPTATCSTAALLAGTHSLRAVYEGDASFYASAGVTTHAVEGPPTTTTVSSSPNPSGYGQAVTITATVQPGDATGTVSFYDQDSLLPIAPQCSNQPLVPSNAGATATCGYAWLPPGTDTITAVYSGNARLAGSTGFTTQTVASIPGTTLTLSTSPNPSLLGQTAILTATVNQANAIFRPTYPTGSVAFSANGLTIPGCGSQPLINTNTGGIATCATAALATGVDSLTAVYSGDASYLGSTGATTQTVLDSYRGRMQTVRNNLDVYRQQTPNPKSIYDHVTAAIANLDKALNTPGLWQSDGRHLTSKGATVFDANAAAVNQLLGVAQPRPAAVTSAVTDIVGIDQLITTLEYNDASVLISSITPTNRSEYQKATTELAAAGSELSKASNDANAARWTSAIGHYKNAWQHALYALQHAAKA